jgi:hypothetical protein
VSLNVQPQTVDSDAHVILKNACKPAVFFVLQVQISANSSLSLKFAFYFLVAFFYQLPGYSILLSGRKKKPWENFLMVVDGSPKLKSI